jgi:hypothetical protein
MEDLVTELENARRENSELAGLLKKKKAECVEHAKREKEGMREKEEEVEALRREVGRVEAEERKRRKGLEAEVGVGWGGVWLSWRSRIGSCRR